MRHVFVFTCMRRFIVFQIGQLSTASSGVHLLEGRKHLLGTSLLQCKNPTLVSGFVDLTATAYFVNKNMLHLYPLATIYIPVFVAGTLWCFSCTVADLTKTDRNCTQTQFKNILQYTAKYCNISFKAGGCGFESQLGWAFPGRECMSPMFGSSRFLPTELTTHRFGLTSSSHAVHECISVYERLSVSVCVCSKRNLRPILIDS